MSNIKTEIKLILIILKIKVVYLYTSEECMRCRCCYVTQRRVARKPNHVELSTEEKKYKIKIVVSKKKCCFGESTLLL